MQIVNFSLRFLTLTSVENVFANAGFGCPSSRIFWAPTAFQTMTVTDTPPFLQRHNNTIKCATHSQCKLRFSLMLCTDEHLTLFSKSKAERKIPFKEVISFWIDLGVSIAIYWPPWEEWWQWMLLRLKSLASFLWDDDGPDALSE